MTQNTTPEQERTTTQPEQQAEQISSSAQTKLTEKDRKRLEFLRAKDNWQADVDKIEKMKDESDAEKTKKEVRKSEFFNNIQKNFETDDQKVGDSFEKLKITAEEKKELKDLFIQAKKSVIQDLKEIRHDLLNSIPEKCFEGNWETAKVQKEKEDRQEAPTFPISLEEMRIRLRVRLPDELRPIFIELFLLKLDLSSWAGLNGPDHILPPGNDTKVEKVSRDSKNKFCITIDPAGCMKEEDIGTAGNPVILYYFSEDKFVYQITRAMLTIVKGENKKEFEDWCEKNGFAKKIDKNDKSKSDDWLAMMLSNYEGSREKVDPKLKEAYEKWLKKLNLEGLIKPEDLPSATNIKSLNIDEEVINNKIRSPWKDKETGEHISGFGLTVLEKWPMGEWLYSIGATIGNIQIIDRQYIHMFLAEEDAKEVKKLLSRDLSGSEYVAMLKQPQYYKNKDKLRGLLMTISNKGYYQWWMAQYFLLKHDSKFRNSQGKEISHDGYDFITRLTKAHQKAVKGPAMAITEYKEVGGRFFRRSFDEQLDIIDGVLEKLPTWQVQHILPDAIELLRDGDDKFIDIDARLGDLNGETKKYNKGKQHFCATDNKMLEKFLPVDEAEKFFNNMKDFSENLNEPEFNNLVGPGILALVRRLKKAATEDREIFTSHTSPIMRQLFEEYKDKVGDAKSTKKKYEYDFKEVKEKIEKNNFDLEEVIKGYSYEEIVTIYNNFSRKRNISPYMRGDEITPRGRLDGFLAQSKETIIEHARVNNVPAEIRDFIASEIDELAGKKLISDKDISKFRDLFEEKTSRLDDKARYALGADINKVFVHLENFGAVKRYDRLFEPYQQKLNSYLGIKGKKQKEGKEKEKEQVMNEAERERANNYFIMKIASNTDANVNDKIKAIRNEFPEIQFSEKEIGKINEGENNQEKNTKILNKLNEKLKELSQTPLQRLQMDYEKLNQLYYEVNEYVVNGVRNYNLDDLKGQFKNLNLIPDEIKVKPIFTLLDLRKYLQLSKVVVSSYYAEKEQKELKNRNRGLIDSTSEMTREDEYTAIEEEEEALAAEEAAAA